MPPRDDPLDPKGLIHEAYLIDGIGSEECRSIFLDWAIGLREGEDSRAAAAVLLARFESEHAWHPMTDVLRAATEAPPEGGRRGGARGRRGDLGR